MQQRQQYDVRVAQAKRQVAEQLRANGMPLSPALEEALKAPMALPPARE